MGPANDLSTTSTWGNPAVSFPRHSVSPKTQQLSKRGGLFSTLTLLCQASSREAVNINFGVIGLTRLGMKPKSTAPGTDAVDLGFIPIQLKEWVLVLLNFIFGMSCRVDCGYWA